jgi:hypothetical protein
LALAAILALFAFYSLRILGTGFFVRDELHYSLVDDAMISMVYARNLAEGQGLVWSSGEAVEGFSNFLWTLVMALLHLVVPDEARIAMAVMFTGALVLSVHAFLAYQLAARLCPENRVAPAAAAMITGLYFPVVFWTLRGLEVGFLCMLATAATILTFDLMQGFSRPRAWGLAILLAAMLWTRLDTLITAAILIAGLAVQGHTLDRRRTVPLVGGSVLAAIATITGFRLVYFGQALPNTFDLKLTGVSLGERIVVGIESFRGQAVPDLWLPTLITIAALLFTDELRSRKTLVLLALFLSQCLYSVYTGGDYAEQLVGGANRFVAQGAPFLFIVCVSAVESAWRRFSKHRLSSPFAVLASLVLASAILLPVSGDEYRAWDQTGAPMLPSDAERVRLGILIRESTDPDAVVACHAAGNIVYFSRRPAVDLLGKSDRHVARGTPAGPFRPGHNKWDYRYSILELAPDLVADDWGEIASFMDERAPGYDRLANGIWVLETSRSVDLDRLSQRFSAR